MIQFFDLLIILQVFRGPRPSSRGFAEGTADWESHKKTHFFAKSLKMR